MRSPPSSARGALCWHYFHWALYLLALLFIGARQHDLLVLMHDGAHYRLFKSRKLNDWMSELFLTWPFFVVSTHGYRANHWAHHRHLNTAEDPDLVGKVGPHWAFPMPARKLLWIVLSDVMGLAQLRTLVIIRRMHKPGATPKPFVRARCYPTCSTDSSSSTTQCGFTASTISIRACPCTGCPSSTLT